MLKNEPKWVVAPPELRKEIPFLKAIPIKALENDEMQFQAETPKGKIPIPAKIT